MGCGKKKTSKRVKAAEAMLGKGAQPAPRKG